jgi:hypothetical protein
MDEQERQRKADEIVELLIKRQGEADPAGQPLVGKLINEAIRRWQESGEPLSRLPEMLREDPRDER